MSIHWLLGIISGKQKGPLAAVIRLALWCATPIYGFAVSYRNRQFDSGSREVESVGARVISIGNVTTGGTGKTPMVIWACHLLQQHKIDVAIVSRGYGSQNGQPNDEAMELKNRLPAVPHVQDPDRVAAARRCIAEHAVETIVLDDGFQHRRLGRDLDVVLVDASNPFGYGHLIPRGLLREPLSSLRRADAIVVTRCDRVDSKQAELIRDRIEIESAAPIAFAKTKATSLIQFDGNEIAIDEAAAGGWFAFSAIGNPDAFETSLVELNFNIMNSRRFRDHHHFSEIELQEMAAAAKDSGADRMVCTHKDLVKVGRSKIDDLELFALKVDVEFVSGRQQLEDLLVDF